MHLPNYKEAKKREKVEYQTLDYSLKKELKNKYCGKKYFLKTYGCQMNEHDSENIKAMLEELGFIEENDYRGADLLLLNTCSIRENAHNKAFGMLGRIQNLKEKNKDIIVGLCGCMAQEEGVVDKIQKKYKWLNFVIGTHNLYQLPQVIDNAIMNKNQEIEVYSHNLDIVENAPVIRDKSYKAYVNIIYGCNKFCTYCIVPYTRGSERSRRKEDILKEIEELISNGYQEVTLLGQNVNAYGKDLYEDYGLGELLEDIAKMDIPRIRFVTSHPWDFTDKMIEKIGKYENIMPSIHLPVQSGSNTILKRMGRRYTKESYLLLFDKLKSIRKEMAISTDIIVGFPGESEEDFQETLDLVKYCQYDNAFTFIYSPRENTPAAKLSDDVSLNEKEKRLYRLNEMVNQYFLKNNKNQIGQVQKVLVEGKSLKNNDMYFGYTESNKLVNFTGENVEVGTIVEVRITDAKTWSLDGELYER